MAQFLILVQLLSANSQVENLLNDFYKNPAKNRVALQKALLILERTKNYDELFKTIDSALVFLPMDFNLLQRGFRNALTVNDTLRVLKYTKNMVISGRYPQRISGVYTELFYRGYRTIADTVIELAIKKWGVKPFLRQLYLTAVNKREFDRAVKYLLMDLKVNRRVAYVLSELERLRNFVSDDVIKKAIREVGEFPELHIVLAKLYFNEGNTKRAVSEALASKDDKLMLSLAERLIQESQFNHAIALLDNVKNKDLWRYHLLRARIYRAIGDDNIAVKEYKFAGDSAKGEFFSYLISLKKYEMVLNEATPEFKTFRISALLGLGKIDEARKELQDADDNVSLMTRAKLELASGNIGKADTLFQDFVLLYPADTMTYTALFNLEMIRTYGHSEAFKFYQNLILSSLTGTTDNLIDSLEGFKPEDNKLMSFKLFILGNLKELESRLDQAIGYYSELISRDSTFLAAYALYKKAKIQMEALADTTSAMDTLKELILRFPNSPYADIARTYF